ncbi:MAG: hypothetical protein GY708_22840 [Actinomycetia bacterium]|nr:hypothetical protein [Actinomycetes bacterium]MCP5034942.1 hypothetical protein [Actinomycetes bacterium]
MLTVGCGGDDEASTTTDTSIVGATSTAAEPTGTTTSRPTTSAGVSTTTGTLASTLPGEPIFSFPEEGDVLAVMAVAHDDVLNVRAVPGADAEVVAELGPTAANAVSTGRARKLSQSIWNEVTVGEVTGWANSSYLGFMGATDDATAEFLNGANPPETETMEAMGELVADGFTPEDPEPGLRIVQSMDVSQGDLAEVAFDVIGVADDAVAGYRLHIFATPNDNSGGFVLRSIERTLFCWRAVSDGFCV